MVLMRTITLPRRSSSEPTAAARSASEGSWPRVARSRSRAASSSRRTRRTPRGQASLRSASIIAPRTRRSAKVSNLIPRDSSKRRAASISPSTPSCTRSPRSMEWGIVAATRRASASTNGRLFSTRGFTVSASCSAVMTLRLHSPPYRGGRLPPLQPRCQLRAVPYPALRRAPPTAVKVYRSNNLHSSWGGGVQCLERAGKAATGVTHLTAERRVSPAW